MRILALGDIFGDEAVKYVSARLGDVVHKLNVDLTVANCENASGAQGVEPQAAESLLAAGCDVLTGGNHSFGSTAVSKIQNFFSGNVDFVVTERI